LIEYKITFITLLFFLRQQLRFSMFFYYFVKGVRHQLNIEMNYFMKYDGVFY